MEAVKPFETEDMYQNATELTFSAEFVSLSLFHLLHIVPKILTGQSVIGCIEQVTELVLLQ
jgi:hypothetical protein